MGDVVVGDDEVGCGARGEHGQPPSDDGDPDAQAHPVRCPVDVGEAVRGEVEVEAVERAQGRGDAPRRAHDVVDEGRARRRPGQSRQQRIGALVVPGDR